MYIEFFFIFIELALETDKSRQATSMSRARNNKCLPLLCFLFIFLLFLSFKLDLLSHYKISNFSEATHIRCGIPPDLLPQLLQFLGCGVFLSLPTTAIAFSRCRCFPISITFSVARVFLISANDYQARLQAPYPFHPRFYFVKNVFLLIFISMKMHRHP